MIPGAAVVARPGCGKALRTRECRSREHKRTLIRLQLQQAFVGGAHIFHAEDVVGFALRNGTAEVGAAQDVQRNSFR